MLAVSTDRNRVESMAYMIAVASGGPGVVYEDV